MTHCSSVVRQLIVELDQRTVCRQNSRHHHHLNRNTQADHHTSARTGERQQKTIVGVTLPGGTSSRCTVWVVVYVAWQELIPGIACVFPGLTGQSTVSVEMVLIRWPKTSSSSRELVAFRETGPRVVEPANANSGFNAPKISRN